MDSEQNDTAQQQLDPSKFKCQDEEMEASPEMWASPDHVEPGAMAKAQLQQEEVVVSARSAAIMARIERLAVTLHQSSTYDGQGPQEVRKVAANVLIKVVDLVLELYPDHPEWVVPLQQLLFGLKDLDRGKPNRLFEPVKVDHCPPNSISDVMFRAIPAAAMTCLMERGGIKRTQAAATIAKRLNALGYTDRFGGAIKGAQVEQWREEAMAKRPKEELAARRYHEALIEVEAKAPQEAVTYLLESLPRLPPPHFPNNPGS
jgi:hypothetical protein